MAGAALLLSTATAFAWQEGPGTDWWYIDANYADYHSSDPLVIEVEGDSSDGQVFCVGQTVDITVDLYAVAQSCGGAGNGAFTEWLLDVSGPSGPVSTTSFNYEQSNSCAVADEDTTLTISYPLTDAGTHDVYASSYAAVAQYWTDVADDYLDDALSFEVVGNGVGTKAQILKCSGVPGKGLDNAPGLQNPFNPDSQAGENAGKK